MRISLRSEWRFGSVNSERARRQSRSFGRNALHVSTLDMKSPGFQLRAQRLQQIFTLSRVKSAWKDDVRVAARRAYIRDVIEHFDLHVDQDAELGKLVQTVLEGRYNPAPPARILVEKSKGLCRQIVMPSIKDMIVLQVLSSALYAALKGKAPTKKAFFEPEEHSFSATGQKSDYGGFSAWLKFQRALLRFAKEREYVIVTDIANYYDTISYVHLRNVLAGLTGEAECVLDMLIFVLSGLLWQPDYMPRVETGLPQIDMDAPRYLAHCFLFELDRYLNDQEDVDFVRFMDDIDIGVDTIQEAKRLLKNVDLLLQTRQVRLNSGKTIILTKDEAAVHFCTKENAELDLLTEALKQKRSAGQSLAGEKARLKVMLTEGIKYKRFDRGNGEKILKRIVGLCGEAGVAIDRSILERILKLRPASREAVLRYLARLSPLGGRQIEAICELLKTGLIVDQAFFASAANVLVEARFASGAIADQALKTLISLMPQDDYYGAYARIVLLSKYGSAHELKSELEALRPVWWQDYRLGRLVGGLVPCFQNTDLFGRYMELIKEANSAGSVETFDFHTRLQSDSAAFTRVYPFIKSPNSSKATGVTHAKYLVLLSALNNGSVELAKRQKIVDAMHKTWTDRHYLAIASRAAGLKLVKRKPILVK